VPLQWILRLAPAANTTSITAAVTAEVSSKALKRLKSEIQQESVRICRRFLWAKWWRCHEGRSFTHLLI